MKLETKTIVITGAASGVGRALALRFAGEHPKGLVLADLPSQAAALEALAHAISNGINGQAAAPAIAVPCDVGVEAGVKALVAAAEARFGHVDMFCSNAASSATAANTRPTPNGRRTGRCT